MLSWQDNQPYSSQFGDIYFSSDSGWAETHHVFLQGNQLAARFTALAPGEHFTIGEAGFGTGLNFLCTWQLFEQTAPPGCRLDFFSVEKFPLTDDELALALGLWPALSTEIRALLARWKRRVPGWNHWHFGSGRVRLTLAIEDIAHALPEFQGGVDAWFLDGFSPAKNPEMWRHEVLTGIAQKSNSGATLATYTSAGWVRRELQQAGFVMEKIPGFGRKREMMRGTLAVSAASAPAKNRVELPDSVVVIGAGVAGCAVANALAQRGILVTLLDQAETLASAASGNSRGILNARLAAGMSTVHQFVLAAYGHVLTVLDDFLPVDDIFRAECGLLQLATSAREAKRITQLSAQDWPTHLMQAVDAPQASVLAGLPLDCAGLWFPSGGWIVPPELCRRLVDHPLISLRLGNRVTTLQSGSAGWHVRGDDFASESAQVVVCCAQQARTLEPFAHLPLQSVRGQVTALPATEASRALRTVLCAGAYVTPAAEGLHLCGATTTFDDDERDIRVADHDANLEQLAEDFPSWHATLGEMNSAQLAGRAAIRCSVPGALPLVGEMAPGLHYSLAHGTRGLLSAGLSAETIAAALCGQLPPLPQSIIRALARLPKRPPEAKFST